MKWYDFEVRNMISSAYELGSWTESKEEYKLSKEFILNMGRYYFVYLKYEGGYHDSLFFLQQ